MHTLMKIQILPYTVDLTFEHVATFYFEHHINIQFLSLQLNKFHLRNYNYTSLSTKL